MTDFVDEVVLGDGSKVRILRRLGLFELDDEVPVPNEVLEPFTYEMRTADGATYEVAYNPFEVMKTPDKPETHRHMVEDGSPEYFAWLEWDTHQAALTYYDKQARAIQRNMADSARYIILNCVFREDRHLIVEPEDWNKVTTSIMSLKVTKEDIEASLASRFPGEIQWETSF